MKNIRWSYPTIHLLHMRAKFFFKCSSWYYLYLSNYDGLMITLPLQKYMAYYCVSSYQPCHKTHSTLQFCFLLLPELEEERPWLSKRTKEESCYWLAIGFPSCLCSKCVYVSIFGNIRCKLTIKIYFVWKSKHKTFCLHCCL